MKKLLMFVVLTAAGCLLKSASADADEDKTRLYCVVDLSAGANAANYPVTYMSTPPKGGFNTEEYKTTKLLLRRIEAGTFKMQGTLAVTLAKPYFCGVFEVTQRQFALVTGENPSCFAGDALPVECVGYDAIRGSANGSKWPSSSAVDPTSFIGRLRARTGLDFDLPTEAQWEYACRAGTTTAYYWGSSMDGDHAWYYANSGGKTHVVGTRPANPWGLYDMCGNVWEWCLDWYAPLAGGADPKGPASGADRVGRGGSWTDSANYCTSSSRDNYYVTYEENNFGFRIVVTLSK